METEIIVFLIAFVYLVAGFRFAKFNVGLWEAKMDTGRFNPNMNMFGTKTPTVENLLFFALFPLSAFLIAIDKAAPKDSFTAILMERHYKKADIIGLALFFPLKFACSVALIAFLFGVVPLAMFAVSIVYPVLTIFTEKPTVEVKQTEA